MLQARLETVNKLFLNQNADCFLLPNASIPPAARCCHGDEMWDDVMDRVKKEMGSAEDMTSSISNEIRSYCSKSGQLRPGKKYLNQL